jgi:hypothetical protein
MNEELREAIGEIIRRCPGQWDTAVRTAVDQILALPAIEEALAAHAREAAAFEDDDMLEEGHRAAALFKEIVGDDRWPKDQTEGFELFHWIVDQVENAYRWKMAFAAQSRKLQSVLHIPGVREALRGTEDRSDHFSWGPGDVVVTPPPGKIGGTDGGE